MAAGDSHHRTIYIDQSSSRPDHLPELPCIGTGTTSPNDTLCICYTSNKETVYVRQVLDQQRKTPNAPSYAMHTY